MAGTPSGPMSDPHRSEATDDGPPRVLLVDDDIDIRHLVRLCLEHVSQFQVVGEAGDGAEAVHLAEQLQPDVVLLDIMMPEMSGHEALPEVLRVSPHSMVVMVSALGAETNEARAVEAGAFAYVAKSEVGVDFGARMADLLGRFRAAGNGRPAHGP